VGQRWRRSRCELRNVATDDVAVIVTDAATGTRCAYHTQPDAR
jgi:hypothetical protein